MAEKLQNLLKELGSKLDNPPANKDALIKLLKQAATCLSELDQSPPKAVLECMQPFVKAIVKPELLKHQDKEVKLLIATCTCEITRVTAPEAPYDDDVLKDIFHLIVSTFSGLRDTKGPSFGRRVTILDTVAKYRSCVVMLDLECHDLVNQIFTTFFAVASDEHSETVIASMKTIMVVLLEESEDISDDLLLIILSVLGRDKKAVTMAARRLAMNVIGLCAIKLEPGIKQLIVQSMSGDSSPLIDYHEVIYDIYRCAPQALSGIVPYLTGELLTDKMELRLKAVKLVGDLFSLPESTIPETFQPIFLEFMKRLTDRVVEVRMSVLEHVKLCMLSNPSRAEAPQLIAAICDRLLDYDESIRKQAVAVVSDVACHALSSISIETVKLVAERLRDKSLLVKKYTLERLSDIYRTWCLKQDTGDGYDWIPGRILRCFYDKDFRSDTVEHILCTSLFPPEFSVRDKVRKWVKLFSKFDKVEVKALEKILEQKQRLQLELQKYLSLRQMYKGIDASEVQQKVVLCVRFMSLCFADPMKAEVDFQLLHQLKDANVWKILTKLLHQNTTSLQTWRSRDELLKIVGEKHPLYRILSTLSIKCSYMLFNKDYVKDVLLEVDQQKSAKNTLLTQSCMYILVMLASFSPLLLSGIEKDLAHLLEDDNEVIREGVLHVVAKAGGTIRDQLAESSRTLDQVLERICLEGSRRQAKHAVHALAAITKDDGFKSLSVLYKKLVDMLEKKTNLPSVLQSLGCIAQTAMPVFETQESKIEGFIKKDILGCSAKPGERAKESWDDRSEVCSLKIFGIKTLVKSYLPVKDAHLRVGIGEVIKDLRNILSFGEISKDIESSCVDKAHLKLASAKAILHLSKHWDNKIPIDVFHLTLTTSEVNFPQVKKLFLNKVHRYIKDRSLDPKYACAFLLSLGPQQSLHEEKFEEIDNLSEIIRMCQQGKARQVSLQNEGNSSAIHHILPYLVHALAHHPECPNIVECKDVKAYEPIYRKLFLFLSMLALGDEDGKPGNSLKKEVVISIISILQSIRSSKDAVDTKMSKNSYAICDLCFSITKRLAQKQEDLHEPVVPVSIPHLLYKPHEKKEEAKEEREEEKEKEEVDTYVTQCQTWLADESALAHFESLKVEANGSVPPKVIEDDILKDSETDGNEVPLGKMLEQLKAKGANERKAVKNDDNSNNNNNVDILGTVTDINVDSSMGNGHEKRKRKRIAVASMNLSLTKRQRSSSAKGPKVSAFDNIKMNDQDEHHSDSEDKLSLGEHIQTEQRANIDDSDLEKKPKKSVDADSNHKSESVKKRKRTSVSGLTKYTSKEGESHTTDLIGRRINVWWPKDKEFYEGVVKSYDHQKKKHVVLYNDGDVEVLSLDKQRWKLIDTKQKNQRHKGGSSKKNNKVLGNLKKNKEPIEISPPSMVRRGKRSPRKNMKHKRAHSAYLEATFSKVETLDTDEEEEPGEKEKQLRSSFMEDEKDNDESESTDDVPLGVWKSQARKSVKGKW